MMLRVFHVTAILLAMAIWPFEVFAQTKSLARILEESRGTSDVVRAINNLEAEDRAAVVTSLQDSLNTGTKGEQVIVLQYLCLISPWSTGRPETDEALREALFDIVVAQPNPDTEASRYADCAQSNRMDTYRQNVLVPMSLMRQNWCNLPPPTVRDEDYLARVTQTFRQVEADSFRVEALWREAIIRSGLSTSPKSYYPLRNQLRLMMLESARAVHLGRTGDFEEAQAIFLDISQDFRDLTSSAEMLAHRNGWRLVTDFEFYEALFSWFGGATDTPEFVALIEKPVIAEQTDFAGPGEIVAELEEDGVATTYRDPIYLERILPGMQEGRPECNAWHARTYDVMDLSNAVMNCVAGAVRTFEGLEAFDNCFLDFEAADWTIQLQTAQGSKAERLQADEAKSRDRLVSFLNASQDVPACLTPQDLSLVERAKNLEVVVRGGQAIATLTGPFCTTEVEWLREQPTEVSAIDSEWLYRRPRTY
jgi:hypothetical protein